MLQKPITCQGCPLYIDGRGFSRPEGKYPSSTGVLIIGEALGSSEVMDALPFRPYAEAGSVLNTAFRFLGYDRSQFILWNEIACQPPFNRLENTAYEYEAINHCKVHFQQVVDKYKPKAILALGNVPLKHLWSMPQEIQDYIESLPETNKEEKDIKKKYLKNFKIGSMRGYVLPSIYGIPMIASFHPSYINMDKGRTQLGTLMRDLQAIVSVARTGKPIFKTVYDEDPTEEKVKDFYNYCKVNPNLVIAHDIETPMTTLQIDESEIEYENVEVRDIDSIQFSVKEGTGIFVPYYGDSNIKYIASILALSNRKIGWNNWKFDEVNLQYHLGAEAIQGEVHDIMWMWKWLNQDFVKTGRALQFATNFFAPDFPVWKHLAQLEPKNYGCLDVDATLRIYNGLVKAFNNPAFRFRSPITGQLEENNTKTVMRGYLDDIVQLRVILKDMSDRGFPIDIKEREKFRKQIEYERNNTLDELQDLYPMHLRRVSPLEGYKFVPKEVHELTELFNSRRNFKNRGKWVATDATEEELAFLLSKYIEIKTRPEDGETTGLVIKEFDFQGHKEKRYCRIQKFKPGSPKQVLDYIKDKKYKVPTKRDYKKGERESTSKDLLQPLWEETGDDLILKCIYIRELANMLNTYVGTGKKEGWKVSSDNRVHAEFLFKPSTGQLSTSPNIQNAPSHGTKFSTRGYVKLAQQFRKIVAAGVGKVLVSSDWSAFHINTLAFEAEDAEYMRIGRIDPHSFLSAEIILGNLQGGLYLTRLKVSKPLHLTDEEWKAKILKYEEATERLKDFTNWLKVPTEELAANLKWFKKNFKLTRDSMAKPAILGMGFGMGVNKFYKTNRHTFKSKAQPEKIHALMKQRFPKTFVEYPEKIKDLADRQTYLITRYGYIRRFYNVYDWRLLKAPRAPKGTEKIIKTQKGQWWSRKDGDSAKEAIAYLPANDAFGVKKECMRALWNHPNGNLCKSFGLINEIHDDLMFEMDEGLVNEALPIIKSVMESPAQFLKNSICPEGLVTKTEMKIGRNWAEMKGIKV